MMDKLSIILAFLWSILKIILMIDAGVLLLIFGIVMVAFLVSIIKGE